MKMKSKTFHWRHSILLLLLAALPFLESCKKEQEVIQNVTYDNTLYDVDTLSLYESNLDKSKQKTGSQYISILYSDLFDRTISSNELLNLSELQLSIGDKQLANELIISSGTNQPDVIMPTDQEMRANVDRFVENTYVRFYLRKPTKYEKHALREMIINDPGLTPELIYTAFATSNEYLFY